MITGYTAGVYDLFHIGHLNILRNARSMCDRLIVGVTTDELLMEYKHKKPIIPFFERCEILRALKYVDVVISQENMRKFDAWKKIKFDIMFVGDDWHDTPNWKEYEMQFAKVNVRIVYFPYTKGTSSSKIIEIVNQHSRSIPNRT